MIDDSSVGLCGGVEGGRDGIREEWRGKRGRLPSRRGEVLI